MGSSSITIDQICSENTTMTTSASVKSHQLGSVRSVLSIAGSDSGGGAGIQADLKTIAAHRLHGLTAVTAVTAQNTRAVTGIYPVPLLGIAAQVSALFADFDIRAVKIGMLGSAAIVRTVAKALAKRTDAPVVLDPVMIASTGARLLEPDAVAALRDLLIPRAAIITPNLPEAELLTGLRAREAEDMPRVAQCLLEQGARAVLLKGGHLRRGPIVDLYADADGIVRITHPRLDVSGHGTGCTLAAALACQLALDKSERAAVRAAIKYVHGALRQAYRPGRGRVAVLDHMWATRRR
jgi:hydroxymethylpyrimidine/phosphomethylpyrimidine kinase